MIKIHSARNNQFGYYYYHCQSCFDAFICPDWTTEINKKTAACPYCKSIRVYPLNTTLPLVIRY